MKKYLYAIMCFLIPACGTSTTTTSSDYLELNVGPSLINTSLDVDWDAIQGRTYYLKFKKADDPWWVGWSPKDEVFGAPISGRHYYGLHNLTCKTEYKVKVKMKGKLWKTENDTTLGCGAVACPYGGYYDGANCQIGKAPDGTTAFIYDGNYYYTAVMTPNCPYPGSSYDTANCYVQAVPPGATPFINVNHWYYAAYPGSEPCPHGGYYDSANCQIGKAPDGTTAFIYDGNYYYTAVMTPNCPYPGSSYDTANCFVQVIPSGVDPFIYQNHWYYISFP